MWSLPDLQRLNAEAALSAGRYEEAARTGFLEGEQLQCEHSEDSRTKCAGDINHYPWHDIFSDDAKGIISLCEKHDGYYGSPDEGFFHCDECCRVFITNYTWEYYMTVVEDAAYCLPCAAKQYIGNHENWIQLTDENIQAIDHERILKSPHVVAHGMSLPKGIELEFIDNVEFDSMSGEKLYSTKNAGVREIQSILYQLQEKGYSEALLILDAAYQFAVSIGVYARPTFNRVPPKAVSDDE